MDDDREPNDLALVAMLCDPAMSVAEARTYVAEFTTGLLPAFPVDHPKTPIKTHLNA